MKRASILVLIILFSVTLFGYVIYLKDGSTYMARDKYRSEGDYAIITLQNGSVIKVKLSLIDLKKTEEYNKKGLTSGEVIELAPQNTTSAPGQKRVSALGDLAKRKPTGKSFGSKPGKNDGIDLRGGDDLAGKKTPFKDEALSRSFSIIFENQNLFQYRIYQGRNSTSMRIEMNTDNENEVFRTVSSVAKKVNETLKTGNKKLNQVELFMSTSAGAPAGRFIISSDKAKELAEGKVTVEAFFIQNVIF